MSEAKGDQAHAAIGAQLRELLRGDYRYAFALIQKFRPEWKCDMRWGQQPRAPSQRAEARRPYLAPTTAP